MQKTDPRSSSGLPGNLVEELGGDYVQQRALFVPSTSRRTPFSSARKMMTTIIGESRAVTQHGAVGAPEAGAAGPVMWVKGAAEMVLKNGTKYVKAQKGQTSLVMAASGSCIVIATADKSKGQVFTSTISAVVALVAYLAQSGY